MFRYFGFGRTSIYSKHRVSFYSNWNHLKSNELNLLSKKPFLQALNFNSNFLSNDSRHFHSTVYQLAGHSRWQNIQYRKKRQDTKKMGMFAKLSKEITTAVRLGGNDLETNLKLVAALSRAKLYNFPKDNVEAAISKGIADKSGSNFDEVFYEGYGPNGVPILIQTLTDSKNRTAQSIRSTFTKHGGNLSGAGSVAWMFQFKGLIIFNSKGKPEEELLEFLLENGVEDAQFGVGENGNFVEVSCSKQNFISLRKAILNKGFEIENSELTFIVSKENLVETEQLDESLQKLIDALEDNPDVQNVYHNLQVKGE